MQLLFCYSLKTLEDREDECCRQEADTDEYTPDEREIHAPHETGNHDEEVTDSSGYKPATHHHTLVLGRCYL